MSKYLTVFFVLVLALVATSGCFQQRAASADDLIVAPAAVEAPAAPATPPVVAPATAPITPPAPITSVIPPAVVPPPAVASSVTITEAKALVAEAIAALQPAPVAADTGAAPGSPLAVVPGAVSEMPKKSSPPIPWNALNGETTQWDVPYGTVLSGETAEYQFTNPVSFNLKPGRSLEVDWEYSSFAYENTSAGFIATHSTYAFLKWNWATANGLPNHEGIGFWGPLEGSTVTVTYEDGAACTGRSFAVVPDVKIHAVFTNSGTTNAVWSQGPWGTNTGHGKYPPECRPGTTTPATASAVPASTPSPTATPVPPAPTAAPAPTAPVAPPADAAMQTTSSTAYGPVSFKSTEAFQIQHLGSFVFHIIGGGYETTAKNFACTWQDWNSGIAEPPWTGNSKVTCVWSPE